MKITTDKSKIKRILQYIDCCIILHNLLIKIEDDGELANEWLEDDEVSDVDDSSRTPTPYDKLYRPIKKGSSNDKRRTRLQSYFEHKEYV